MSDCNFSPLVQDNKLVNTTNEVINCLNPIIIINPCLKDLIYKFGNYTFDGRQVLLSPSARRTQPAYFHYSFFKPRNLTLDDLNRYYVTDFSTGELYPMYIAVKCGHCDICKSSKIDAFSERCVMETQCYTHLPYFLTLTYDDRHLPADGLSVQHTQDFLKRLRARLDYAGFNDHFRYVCVGEYGSNTHRAHYHLILWNLYPFRGCKYYQLRNMIRQSWSKGFIYLSVVSPTYRVRGRGHGFSKPEKCFEYVAKYINKDCFVPPGQNSPFLTTSRRFGGIGAPFLDRHKDYIRKHFISRFSYVDSFTFTLRVVSLSRYNLERLFPSFVQSVPLELRNAIRSFCKLAPFIKHGDGLIKTLHDHFKDCFWPLHRKDDLSSSMCIEFESWLSHPGARSLFNYLLWQDIQVMIKYKDFDFRKSLDLASLRIKVLADVTKVKHIVQLLPRASRWRHYRDLSLQREFF